MGRDMVRWTISQDRKWHSSIPVLNVSSLIVTDYYVMDTKVRVGLSVSKWTLQKCDMETSKQCEIQSQKALEVWKTWIIMCTPTGVGKY
jgi:hypothetical protein